MFNKIVLKNGLRIITIPQENTQAVTVLVLVNVGSKNENKKNNGISHFLEHMFFKGTKKRPSTVSIAEDLDRVGGIYNAFTSKEYTGYFAKVDNSHLDLALDWVSDIFLNSKLNSEEIEREKKVIIEEINMYYDNPMKYIYVLWYKLLYGDQPAGWDIAGTKEKVSLFTRKDLIDYLKNQYVAEETIVCVAGKINSSKNIVSKIKKYFAGIKTNQSKKRRKVIEKKQITPQVLLHTKQTDQVHICLGAKAYDIFHPEKYSQELLGIILGEGMSSRLFIKIRERLGLAYYIHTDVSSETDTGFLATQAGIDSNKIDLGISSILEEYKSISQKKISTKELQKAKDYLKGRMSLLLETSDAQAMFCGTQELLEKKILSPKEIFKKIDKITENDILKTAKNIFQPDKLNLAIIGPFKEKERFEKLLKF